MVKSLSSFTALSTLSSILLSWRGLLVLNHLDDKLLGHLVVYQVVSMMFIYSSFGLLNGTFRYYVKNPDRIGYSNLMLIILLLLIQLPVITIVLYALSANYIFFLLAMGALSYIQNMMENTLLAQSKFQSHATLSVISSTLSLMAVYLSGENNLEIVFIAFALYPLVYILIAVLLHRGTFKYSCEINIGDLKYLFVEGWPFAVISVLAFITNQGDKLIFNWYYGEEVLGRYYIVFVAINLVVLLPRIVTQYFLPSIVDQGSEYVFWRKFRWNTYLVVLYSILVVVTIFVASELDFQPIGDGNIDYNLLLRASPLFVLVCYQFLPSLYWHFTGYLKSMMWISLVTLVVYFVALSVLLDIDDFYFIWSKIIYFFLFFVINVFVIKKFRYAVSANN
ncbi:MAG TPA: hypothetical protein DCR48_03890 [Flavobacteriales bacterium]|nr:hypothetical protein [Flavobacteriales bacterium]